MAQAGAAHSTTATLNLATAIDILKRAGLRLETNGVGFQIAHSRQILIGCGRRNYEMTAADVCRHVERTLMR